MRVILYGLVYGREIAELAYCPPSILRDGLFYDRVDDPDTGEFLGCYTERAVSS